MSDGMVIKPVWRLNTGVTPADVGELRYKHSTGLSKFSKLSKFFATTWDLYEDKNDIYAYQTNRTKPAKYR